MISSLAQGFDSDFLEVARKREHHQTDSTKSMARSGRAVIPLVLAVALLASRCSVFVPPPSTSRLPAAAVAVPALLAGAPAAFADAIGDAAAKFSDATYPIAKKIDWGILDETSTL